MLEGWCLELEGSRYRAAVQPQDVAFDSARSLRYNPIACRDNINPASSFPLRVDFAANQAANKIGSSVPSNRHPGWLPFFCLALAGLLEENTAL